MANAEWQWFQEGEITHTKIVLNGATDGHVGTAYGTCKHCK